MKSASENTMFGGISTQTKQDFGVISVLGAEEQLVATVHQVTARTIKAASGNETEQGSFKSRDEHRLCCADVVWGRSKGWAADVCLYTQRHEGHEPVFSSKATVLYIVREFIWVLVMRSDVCGCVNSPSGGGGGHKAQMYRGARTHSHLLMLHSVLEIVWTFRYTVCL